MSTITKTGEGGNKMAPEPYDEMVARQLISAIRYFKELLQKRKGNYFDLPLPDNNYRFPKSWATEGRLPLDYNGRQFLRCLGIANADLRIAVNEAVRSGRLERTTARGVSYLGLKGVSR